MSTVEFRTLGFSPRYRCWARDGVPTQEPVISFPDEMPTKDSQSARFMVGFACDDGSSWTGSFAREFDGCADLLFACPDPMAVCVVAGGLARVIDVAHPDRAYSLDVVPVTNALGYPPAEVLFVATFNSISAFDAAMKPLWLTDLESDGIEFGEVDAGVLKVMAYMPGFGDWVPRTISMTDGVVSELKV
jgi:hypothetical protein